MTDLRHQGAYRPVDLEELRMPSKGRTRPKGQAPWSPRHGSRNDDIRRGVQEVFATYQAVLPLGPRAVGYRLLGLGAISKTDRDFSKVVEVIGRMRRSGELPWEWVSDGRTRSAGAPVYSGPDALAEEVESLIGSAQFDRLHHQPVRIELWSEKLEMIDSLAHLVARWGVQAYSGSGSVPIGAVRQTAIRAEKAWRQSGQPTVVLMVGDFDPNGHRNIALPFIDDVRAFVPYVDVRCERVALTPAQLDPVEPTALTPTTARQRRAGWAWDVTCQVDALPPDELADLVRQAVANHLSELENALAVEIDHRLRKEARRIAGLADRA